MKRTSTPEKQFEIFKKDRESEIKGLAKLLVNSNVSVTGEYGVGKTDIIIAASKLNKAHLVNIDYMKLNINDNLFKQISSKCGLYWKLSFMIKSVLAAFIKYILTTITVFEAVYLPISFSTSFMSDHTQLAIIIAALPLIGYFALLFTLLVSWIILGAFFGFKKKYILLSEINFANDFENLNKIIWTINKMFKNYRIILESSGEISIALLNKFKCEEFNVVNSGSSNQLFEKTINELKVAFSNNETDKKIMSAHIELLPGQLTTIFSILSLLPHRTVEAMMNSLTKTFKHLRGEISILDFILVKYLFHRNKELYNFVNSRYDEIQKFFTRKKDKNNANNEDLKKLSADMFEILDKDIATKNMLDNFSERKILPEKYDSYFISNDMLFNKIEIKEIAPFAVKQYKLNYFSTYSYAFLDAELIDEFLKHPLEFIKRCNNLSINIRALRFELFTDEECIKFVETIEGLDFTFYDEINPIRTGFSDYNAIELIPNLMLKSRKNKKEFMLKMSSQTRMIFLQWYFYDKFDSNNSVIRNEFNELHNFKEINYKDFPKFFVIRPQISFKYMKGLKLQLYNQQMRSAELVENKFWNIILRNCLSSSTSIGSTISKTTFVYTVFEKVWGKNSKIVLENVKSLRDKKISLYYNDGKKQELIDGEPVKFSDGLIDIDNED